MEIRLSLQVPVKRWKCMPLCLHAILSNRSTAKFNYLTWKLLHRNVFACSHISHNITLSLQLNWWYIYNFYCKFIQKKRCLTQFYLESFGKVAKSLLVRIKFDTFAGFMCFLYIFMLFMWLDIKNCKTLSVSMDEMLRIMSAFVVFKNQLWVQINVCEFGQCWNWYFYGGLDKVSWEL